MSVCVLKVLILTIIHREKFFEDLPCSAHSQIHLQRLLDGNKCAFIEPAIKYWYTEAADKEAQEKEEVEREEEEEMGDLTM